MTDLQQLVVPVARRLGSEQNPVVLRRLGQRPAAVHRGPSVPRGGGGAQRDAGPLARHPGHPSRRAAAAARRSAARGRRGSPERRAPAPGAARLCAERDDEPARAAVGGGADRSRRWPADRRADCVGVAPRGRAWRPPPPSRPTAARSSSSCGGGGLPCQPRVSSTSGRRARGGGPLGVAADVPALPQVAALVSGEDVQSGRQAEADAGDQRIREGHAGQVDGRELAQERVQFLLRAEERRDGVASGGEPAAGFCAAPWS